MTESRKIQIRPAGKSKIRVSEKRVYTCRGCFNKYYSLFYFCPQCLGALAPTGLRQTAVFKIVSLQRAHKEDLTGLLQFLSEQKTFDFEKALRSLPWNMIEQTDVAVLEHWKEVIEAQGAETEILLVSAMKPAKRKKGSRALFTSDAPLPSFFSGHLDLAIRNVAQLIRSATLRLQWAEAVGVAFRIIESSYKHHPDQRILFSDLLYKIEEELQTSVHDFQAYYRAKEEEFASLIQKLRSSFEEMESEMQAIRRQVQEQL